MKIVKVFRTNVEDWQIALQIILFLEQVFTQSRINFDLDDCDRVLRVESRHESIEEAVIQLMVTRWGYSCEPLP
ncbi:MAG TPA: hypothetical protein VKR41_09685 [Puia sp.]|nr:hypothetical protein [Puia sp.]